MRTRRDGKCAVPTLKANHSERRRSQARYRHGHQPWPTSASMLGPGAKRSPIKPTRRDGTPAAWQFGPQGLGADDGHDDLRRQGNFAKVGNLKLDEVHELIDIVVDSGVNLIDTANVYSGGGSEELIGEAMGAEAKPGMLIATQHAFRWEGRTIAALYVASDPRVRASLKRLRTDVIDLYQVHQWDGLTPLEETMEALDSLVRSGKVRYVGCSNWSGWHMMKAMEVAPRQPHPVRVRSRFTTRCRRAKPNTNSFPSRSIRSSLSSFGARSPEDYCPASIAATRPRRKEAVRSQAGKSRRFATKTRCGTSSTNWSRSLKPIASQVHRSRWPGCWSTQGDVADHRRADRAQFRDNLASVDVKLTDDEPLTPRQGERIPLIYPYWHQSWTAKDRLGHTPTSPCMRPS